jgi:hypothetical protein
MPNSKFSGFPNLDHDPEDEATRPMPLHELPRQVQIDDDMALIRSHHARIADAIDMFWGHKDCVEYLEQLILNGSDGGGRTRIGFKKEVIAALMNLITLHQFK